MPQRSSLSVLPCYNKITTFSLSKGYVISWSLPKTYELSFITLVSWTIKWLIKMLSFNFITMSLLTTYFGKFSLVLWKENGFRKLFYLS